MVIRNFLLGLSKFILGLILAMLIMTLAGASMLRYFMARNAEPPERPTYTNDLPEEPPAEATVPESNQPSVSPAIETAPEEPPAEPEAPETPEAPTVETSDGTYSVVVTQPVGLILRSGPGTDYANIGGVDYEESVTVLAEENGWLNILLSNGEEGWVKDGNVSE
ncbi:Bacterial SH3 domain family [Synechococcus sp. PCC 7335]|uniref:SH3 domain-containing protein n=1 Tax=Synechococcus sp. (strain ATCC 29403 / PCC 7335) TaxID=91464 RepID=UPI00017EE388|nr:SH3 domain-containing protein [Synechococcus sp. PCC 7335]EDX87142.1 Bacterial SH3 domain family [Synechococcus sp. PCC 7335]